MYLFTLSNLLHHNTPTLHTHIFTLLRTHLQSAVDKSKMFVERRALVEQRLRRDPRFATSAAAAAAAAATSASREGPLFEITRIEALLGQSGERCVFGMLTEVADGVWHIEDENASIRVDLSRFATQEVRKLLKQKANEYLSTLQYLMTLLLLSIHFRSKQLKFLSSDMHLPFIS